MSAIKSLSFPKASLATYPVVSAAGASQRTERSSLDRDGAVQAEELTFCIDTGTAENPSRIIITVPRVLTSDKVAAMVSNIRGYFDKMIKDAQACYDNPSAIAMMKSAEQFLFEGMQAFQRTFDEPDLQKVLDLFKIGEKAQTRSETTTIRTSYLECYQQFLEKKDKQKAELENVAVASLKSEDEENLESELGLQKWLFGQYKKYCTELQDQEGLTFLAFNSTLPEQQQIDNFIELCETAPQEKFIYFREWLD